MSSNRSQDHISPSNLAMLRDVLTTVGFRGAEATASSDPKHAASLFAYSAFRNGKRTKASLLQALERCDAPPSNDLHTDVLLEDQAIDRWQDAGRRQ
jgi:hypothetical protein